jgi:methylated-DNA-[protein]-cysteine S-methyltransferase
VKRAHAGYNTSVVGTLTVLQGPRGVFWVSFRREPTREVESLVRKAGFDWEHGVPEVFGEFDDYFAGRLKRFRTRVDLRLVTGFRRRTLEELLRVPYGRVLSYGELARRVGSAGAARAVGGAMRTNPVPILAPCHRVTAHDGSLGGFSAGLAKKRALLQLEGVALDSASGH